MLAKNDLKYATIFRIQEFLLLIEFQYQFYSLTNTILKI